MDGLKSAGKPFEISKWEVWDEVRDCFRTIVPKVGFLGIRWR